MTKMLTLYTKKVCPFCDEVKNRAKELGVSLNERDVADPKNLNKLIENGGKRLVPFLIDEGRGISMYESNDIIRYLENNYA